VKILAFGAWQGSFAANKGSLAVNELLCCQDDVVAFAFGQQEVFAEVNENVTSSTIWNGRIIERSQQRKPIVPISGVKTGF